MEKSRRQRRRLSEAQLKSNTILTRDSEQTSPVFALLRRGKQV
jgi:hypothetical protein